MVGVTFKAARLGRFRSGMVAGSASRNSWQQQIRALLARQGRRMTTFAGHESVLGVIEPRVRHIASRNIRWRDFRERCAVSDYERMALFASLAP